MLNILKNIIPDYKDITSIVNKLISNNLSKKAWTHIIFLRWDKPGKTWCFDMPILGIVDEPFVQGMPEIIENQLIESNKLKEAQAYGVSVLFSGQKTKPKEFKHGHYCKLEKIHEEDGGCWYKDSSNGFEGWLCPQLFKFFSQAPEQIHICIRS